MRRAHYVTIFSVLMLVVLTAAGPAEAPVADAAMQGRIDQVRALLRDGEDVNAAQGDGMSALHWAAERGDAEMVEVLVVAGAEVEAITRIGGYTPLHIASRGARALAVQALIEQGADVNARTAPSGSTPIHLAAAAGDAGVIRMLVEHGADANAREAEWQQTPLIFAASWNRVDAIIALIEGGADPNIAAESMDLVEMGKVDAAANRRRTDVLNAFTNDNAWAPTSAQIQAAVRSGRTV